jgi:hypothetical protein
MKGELTPQSLEDDAQEIERLEQRIKELEVALRLLVNDVIAAQGEGTYPQTDYMGDRLRECVAVLHPAGEDSDEHSS